MWIYLAKVLSGALLGVECSLRRGEAREFLLNKFPVVCHSFPLLLFAMRNRPKAAARKKSTHAIPIKSKITAFVVGIFALSRLSVLNCIYTSFVAANCRAYFDTMVTLICNLYPICFKNSVKLQKFSNCKPSQNSDFCWDVKV